MMVGFGTRPGLIGSSRDLMHFFAGSTTGATGGLSQVLTWSDSFKELLCCCVEN